LKGRVRESADEVGTRLMRSLGRVHYMRRVDVGEHAMGS
jgi:hypothetical protein